MFESLSDRLTGALAGLRGKGRLTDADIDATTREIRLALLEADVSLATAKAFVARVKERAVGANILESLTPAQTILTVLSSHGFDVSRATLVDGSGLSVNDAVPATLLTELLSAAAAPDKSPADEAHQQRTAALRPLLVGLPVAGSSGTLADRYHGPAAGGRGWIRAKTGTLTSVNSLAGTVLDADGRMLVFALLSNGPNPVSVRPRLDALAAGLRSCGCH